MFKILCRVEGVVECFAYWVMSMNTSQLTVLLEKEREWGKEKWPDNGLIIEVCSTSITQTRKQ
jgi:hypothetical protein